MLILIRETAEEASSTAADLVGRAIRKNPALRLGLAAGKTPLGLCNLPLGIGNGVLYGGLVVLSLALPGRKAPLIVASVCSVLALSDVFLGVTFPNVPLWMGISNRLFSLTAIWVPVVYFLQRRKIEAALREAHDELEVRVEERTRELALGQGRQSSYWGADDSEVAV